MTNLLLGPIVGGLAHNRANIWARADAPADLRVWLATRANASDAQWIGSVELITENGCMGIFPLAGPKPETPYHYAISLNKKRPPGIEFHAFITFPKPGAARDFSFVVGSCYRPTDAHGGGTLDELHRHIQSDGLRFGLFLGDQIYADSVEYNGLGRVAVTNEIEGVRILAGDLHSGHAVTAELKCPSGRRIPIAEFCTSPFEQKSVWLRFAYAPLCSKWLARQQRHFYKARRNFGIVQVNFDFPEPVAAFALHYNNQVWQTKTIKA